MATHTSHLTKCLRECGCSAAGAEFAVLALDPFHDYDSPIQGLPDGEAGRSIVYSIKQEINISAPTSVIAGQTWDAHIAFLPVVSELFDGIGPSRAARLTTNTADVGFGMLRDVDLAPFDMNGFDPRALIVIAKVRSGQKTFSTDTGATVPVEYQYIFVDQLTDYNRSRLISGGYEIHNVTEELHKGGAVTDYSVDDSPSHGTAFWFNSLINESTTVGLNMNALYMNAPPNTLASAKQINGVTREAREGSYVTFKFDSTDFKCGFPAVGQVIYRTEDNTSANTSGVWASWAENLPATGVTFPNKGLPLFRELNFQQCGSYYTGLSFESVLNLNLQCMVEEFTLPGSANMALASPSTPYDPRTLEMIMKIQNQMRPGVKVIDNGIGDFFRSVLRAAKGILSTGKTLTAQMAFIPGPVGQFAKGMNKAIQGGLDAAEVAKQALPAAKRPPRPRNRPRRRNNGNGNGKM
jgi:hypothetical protein